MAQAFWNKLADDLRSMFEKQSDLQEGKGRADSGTGEQLSRALSRQDTAATAMALDKLEPEQAARAFEMLDESRAVEVLGKLGPASTKAVSESLPEDRFRRLVEQLPERKAAAAVAETPRDRASCHRGCAAGQTRRSGGRGYAPAVSARDCRTTDDQ